MGVVVITPRDGDLVDLALAKAHLRVEHADHDALVRAHIEAAASWLDGPQGWLGKSLGRQTLRFTSRGSLTRCGVDLPCGPVFEITAITYGEADLAGPVDVDPAIYEIEANRVRLKHGAFWPGPLGASIEVTYVAGYEAGKLPSAIQSAILLHLNILYDQPEDRELAALERARDDLLSPFRERKF